jgi:hypothetical protein
MPSTKLIKEFKYYIEHQEELVKKYNGKVIVIKDEQVLGAYNSDIEAINATIINHKKGTFLVQLCAHGAESYTQRFHSRVAFA